MLWWILFVVSAIVIYVKILKPLRYWRDRKLPYQKPWPVIGNMRRMVFRSTSFAGWIEETYKNCKTRCEGYHQFMAPTLLIKDIELVKQICIKHFDNFLDHRSLISVDVEPMFGLNIFALTGERWRHMRSTLSPAFTSSKMRAMYVLISDCAEQFTSHFLKNADPKTPQTVDMKDVFTRFANDVIATSAFGIKCDSLEERNNEFYYMGKKVTNFEGLRSLKFFGYNVSPFLMKLFSVKLLEDDVSEFFRNCVINTMNTREKQGIIRPDMIHLLMQARKGTLKFEESAKVKDEDAGFATVDESHVGKETQRNKPELTDDEITAQAVLFFIAGFDTISTMMCHMAHELAVNPNIQKRLQTEIGEILEMSKGKITYEAVMNMKYLDMVVCETLRKWPPSAMTDRLCTKDVILDPIGEDEEPLKLYKGEVVMIPVYGIHRDPKYFPNPDCFDPERFSDDNKDSILPMSYIPFGVGPRNCIGSRFALLEAKTVFVHLLSKFDFVVDKKTQVPLKLSRSNFTLMAEKGFWLGLKTRSN